VLFPAALLFNLTGGLASFGIIFYARDVFHASAAQIGWLVAMPQIAYLAGCLFFPPLFGLLLARHYLIVATGGTALLLAGLLVRVPEILAAPIPEILAYPSREVRNDGIGATRAG
jgi:MFS family permease